jgi:subtilisin-like proprotein convertase family protein
MAGDATVAATAGTTGTDFAVVRYQNVVAVPSSVSGTVFEDLNGNGVRDAGEPPLSGWTVFQDVNNNGQLDTGNATFNSTGDPLPIPDGPDPDTNNPRPVTSSIPVAGLLGGILDVNVTVAIDHDFDPDLSVTLISPKGTRVLLFADAGTTPGTTGTANFDNTTLDDQAALPISAGRPPFQGSYRPQEPLSGFNGEDANGVWKLEVTDTAADDTGTLKSWSITIATRGEPSVTTGADGSYSFPNLTPGTYNIRQVPQEGFTQSAPGNGAGYTITLAEGQQVTGRDFGNFRGTVPSEVVGRKAFYNNSRFDGRNPAANADDLAAVATDKRALLPGDFASSLNVTSYTRGLNGIVVELRNLAPAANPTAADFAFKAGNGTDPSAWLAGPAPAQVVTVRSPIPEEPARVFITWADGAILNKWLQVTTLATANTGLRQPDVFYFGNLVGETGDQPSGAPSITMRDFLVARRSLGTRGAGVTSHVDFDRDGDVDALDLLAIRRNLGQRLSSLGGTNTGAPGPAGTSVFSEAPVVAAGVKLTPARVWDEQPADLF